MIYTDETLQIEEKIDELVSVIINSKASRDFINDKVVMTTDENVVKQTKELAACKERFERIAEYGEYAPDYNKQKRELWQKKRELDMLESVAKYRQSEVEFQSVLDLVTYHIGMSVSPDIKINAGNPFFEFADKGCGGCHGRK